MARPTISIRTLLDNAGLSRGANEAEGILSGLGGKATVALAGVGTAAGALAVKGFVDALDQQAIGDKFAAQMGQSAAESAVFMEQAAGLYGAAWGDSIDETAAALAEATRAFGEDANIEALTEQAFGLASAFDGDVTDTIQDATELMASFGISGEEAMDLLAAGLSGTTTEVRDELSSAIREYGGFFDSLGVSAEETVGLLAAFGEDGAMALDKAADAIKELTIRGSDMSAASVDAFGAAGLDAEAMAEALLSGGDVAGDAMQQIAEGLLSIEDPVEQAAAAIALFGTPLEDLGVSEIPDFLDTLGDMGGGFEAVEGAAAAMSDQLGDNLTTKFESLKRRGLQVLADVMTEHVLPVLERFVAWWETNWPQIQATVQRVMAVVVPVIRSAMETIREVVTAVVELVTAIWDQWGDEITAVVETVWPLIERVIKGVTDVIIGIIKAFTAIVKGDWSALWDAVQQIFSGAWDAITATLELVFEGIKAIFGTVWDGIKKIVSEAVDEIVETATEWPGEVIDTIAGFASDLYEAAAAAFGQVVQAMKDKLLEIGQWLRDNVLGPILGVVDDIAGAFGRLADLNPFDGSFLGFGGGDDVEVESFHRGGTVTPLPRRITSQLGIAPNERPTLLEAGEVVLTAEQAAGGGGAPLIGVMNVTSDRTIDQELRLAQALRAAS